MNVFTAIICAEQQAQQPMQYEIVQFNLHFIRTKKTDIKPENYLEYVKFINHLDNLNLKNQQQNIPLEYIAMIHNISDINLPKNNLEK